MTAGCVSGSAAKKPNMREKKKKNNGWEKQFRRNKNGNCTPIVLLHAPPHFQI